MKTWFPGMDLPICHFGLRVTLQISTKKCQIQIAILTTQPGPEVTLVLLTLTDSRKTPSKQPIATALAILRFSRVLVPLLH
jgi:hypothetical protein